MTVSLDRRGPLALAALLACLLAAAGARGECLTPASGLVGFWPANGSPDDVQGHAPTNTFFGTAYTPAVAGNGFWFANPSSNLVYVDPVASQRVSTGMTLEGWIYFQPLTSQNDQGQTVTSLANATIAAAGPVDGVNPLAWQFVIRIPDPATQVDPNVIANPLDYRELALGIRRADGTTAQLRAVFAQSSPEWTHVAATYDGATGAAKIYVNSALVNSFTFAAGNVGSASGDQIMFGVLPFPNDYQQGFQGAMDELSLYDRALSASEVQAVWAAWTNGKCIPVSGTCYTAGFVTACAPSWTEGPTGFYVASGDIDIGPVQGSPYFVVRNGEVKIGPGVGSLSYKGTLVVPTPLGDIPLYSTQGTSRWNVTTDDTWYPNELNGSFTRLLDGLPAFTISGLDLNNFPFASVPPSGIGIDLGNGCIFGTPNYSFDGLPENGAFSVAGHFDICADTLQLHGGVDTFHVNVAGCDLLVENASLSQEGSNLGFYADHIGLSLPLQGGAFRANARGVFVSPYDVHVAGGDLSLPPLSLGPFHVGYAEATLYPRVEGAGGGYRLCGRAGFEFPDVHVGADLSFARLGGELPRGSGSGTFPPTPVIPGIPVFVDRLGGCLTLPTSTQLFAGEECNNETFTSGSGCLTGDCNLGLPEVALTTRILAGVPTELGGGYLMTADPVSLAFGPLGFRASADIYALNNYFGTGEVCVSSWGAEMCSAVDVGRLGFITGNAHLYIGDGGIEGTFDACVNFQQKCFLGHCWDEPTSYSAFVGVGRFNAGWRDRYGFWAGASACEGCNGGFVDCWPSATVAFDLRSGEFFWSGVKPLPHGSGILAKGAVPEGDRLFGPFIVPIGVTEIVFIADGDGAPLDVTVLGPDGLLQEGDEGVTVERKIPEGITLFGVTAPAPGAWTMTAHGATPEMIVEGDAATIVGAASVDATEPAGETSSLHVAWTATIPADAEETTLTILAAPTDELAAAGAGRPIHEQPLVAGPDAHDIAPWELETGTWSIVLKLDDGMGHVSHVVAPGHVIVLDEEAPEPPASAAVVSMPGGARVTWTASPSPDVVRYEVVHEDPLGGDSQVLPAGNVLSLDVTGLQEGEQRRFFARAVDGSGNASASTEAGVAGSDASADGTPPEAPSLDVVALGPGALRATWNAPSDAVSYVVRYGITADLQGGLADEGASPIATAATTIDLTGFEPGAHVFVAVRALDAAGNPSELSNVADALLTDGADSDGDGLPDDWETLWMGSLEDAGGVADTDGDWLTDQAELALGFDPQFPSPFAWGDIAPAGSFDGKVDISDVVRELRLSLQIETADEDVARRAEVAPATLLESGNLRPTRAEPMRVTIGDVVLLLRAAVGLSVFDAPFPPGG